MSQNNSLLNLFFEFGQLRQIKHDGWRLLNLPNPESVAEHSLRAAQIAFFLAKMEKYENPYEVVSMLVFHDIGECRVGDINKLENAYVEAQEEKAVRDQLSTLEDGKEVVTLWQECEYAASKPGIIAKDADYLEQAITAKEYIQSGYKMAEDWITNVRTKLKTDSAKALLEELANIDPTDWWQGLKQI